MRQKLFFALLYFAEGAPIGFIWWALPAILSERGFALDAVSTLMALAVLPWSFKFLFAPFIDTLNFKGVRIKKQLFFFQFMMGLSALAFTYFIDLGDLRGLTIVLLLHAFCAAAQDVCIDTLAIRSVDPEKLGSVNGYMQAGVLVGRSLFGGVSLYVVHWLGLSVLVYLMASCIWIATLTLFLSGLEEKAPAKTISVKQYFVDLRFLFSIKKTWLLIVATFFGGFAFKGISGVDSAALVNIGVESSVRSFYFAVLIPALMLVGALLGGRWTDLWGGQKTVNIFLIWGCITSLLYAASFDFVHTGWGLHVSLSLFYLGVGLITASMYAYLMRHTHREFAAFEFSLFMAATNLSESACTWFSGAYSGSWSFSGALIPQLALVLVAILCFRKVNKISTLA